MISLTDYLGYLNEQFVSARRQADLAAVAMAKVYAEDEYLKHFKVPRFTMPVVKLNVPIKIDAVNQETKYDFTLNPEDLLGRVNKVWQTLAKRYQVRLPKYSDKDLAFPMMQAYMTELDQRDGGFVRDVDYALSSHRVDDIFDEQFAAGRVFELKADIAKELLPQLRQALFDAIKVQFKPLITNINSLSVTPEASGLSRDDSDKLLIHLDLELVEESIQLRKITDENGHIIEEIMVD